jgi:hypothetical protein
MEVSGQLHAPAALHPGAEPPVLIRQVAGWVPKPVWTLWSRENLGNRNPAFRPVARHCTDWAIPTVSTVYKIRNIIISSKWEQAREPNSWRQKLKFQTHANYLRIGCMDRGAAEADGSEVWSVKPSKVKKWSYPCNRPWRPIGVWQVEAPTSSRQSAHRWR